MTAMFQVYKIGPFNCIFWWHRFEWLNLCKIGRWFQKTHSYWP